MTSIPITCISQRLTLVEEFHQSYVPKTQAIHFSRHTTIKCAVSRNLSTISSIHLPLKITYLISLFAVQLFESSQEDTKSHSLRWTNSLGLDMCWLPTTRRMTSVGSCNLFGKLQWRRKLHQFNMSLLWALFNMLSQSASFPSKWPLRSHRESEPWSENQDASTPSMPRWLQ